MLILCHHYAACSKGWRFELQCEGTISRGAKQTNCTTFQCFAFFQQKRYSCSFKSASLACRKNSRKYLWINTPSMNRWLICKVGWHFILRWSTWQSWPNVGPQGFLFDWSRLWLVLHGKSLVDKGNFAAWDIVLLLRSSLLSVSLDFR